MKTMLQLKNIFKSYTTGDFTQVALNGVSLKFRESEFVAILGPSGSGKTTCLNVIGGLDRYDEGDVIINGKSTKEFRDADWDAYRNNSIGFVFQNYNLIAHLSVLDNVGMGMTLSGVSSAERRKRAMEALKKVDLEQHSHKRPNQLSGGQMQRVAIARALVNNPDIVLADEPTGSLDSQTSKQIMDIMKEISKDRLVILVTHNQELADKYADRIVRLKDGEVVSDSNPPESIEVESKFSLKKTGMSFLTALKLSGTNISTKKWRTALTSFASGIGIIGIALVLSLSNGLNKKIEEFESNTLSTFPITVTQTTTQITSSQIASQRRRPFRIRNEPVYSPGPYVYPHDPEGDIQTHTNIFSREYLEYIGEIDPQLLSGISYTRFVNMNLLRSDGETAKPVSAFSINFTSYPENLNPNQPGYLEKSYLLLAGSYPVETTDLVMIVDKMNQLDKSVLQALGMDYLSQTIDYETIIGRELKAIPNDEYYVQRSNYFTLNGTADNLSELYKSDNSITLKIVGIIRPRDEVEIPFLPAGIAYSNSLARLFIGDANESAIVKAQREADYNVLTGALFDPQAADSSSLNVPRVNAGFSNSSTRSISKETMLSYLGADSAPHSITLYPADFDAKESVIDYLNSWNEGKSDEETVIYSDLASTITDTAGGILNGITLVLIAFAAISLIVSLIMIGIVTYISVLERTKEIGVLRSLGARKRDITRVFNAETFIIGGSAGLLGIAIAYLLTFPVNRILLRLTNLSGVAQLNPLHALLLVLVSVALTMLGGLIPARMAAHKDPVEALRAE